MVNEIFYSLKLGVNSSNQKFGNDIINRIKNEAEEI